MKNLLVLVVGIFVTCAAFARQQGGWVKGNVKFSDKQMSVTVSVKGTSVVTRTDAEGNFSVFAPVGKQTIYISQESGHIAAYNVLVKAGETVTMDAIVLGRAPQTLQEVVVTGQFEPQALKQSVYQVRVIGNDQIRLRSPVNVQQVLSTELGFRFSNDLTLGTADVQLMGMNGRNVKILLDGVPMIDRSDTRESLNQVDINSVERIEIVEGPMSVVYGTDALAGVVNIITKKHGNGTFSVALKVQEETAGDEYEAMDGLGLHNQHVGVTWRNRHFNVITGFTRNNFGGWKVGPPTAVVQPVGKWLPKEQFLANAKIGYRSGGFDLWYRIDALKEALDSKSPMNANNYRAKFATYNTDRITQQLQSNYKFHDKLQLDGLVGFTTLNRATRTVVHDFTNNTEELTTAAGEQDIAKFSSAIFRSTLRYSVNDKLSIQPGVEINLDRASGARIKGQPGINDFAAFLSAEWKLTPRLSLRPGIRSTNNSVYNAPLFIPSINAKIIVSPALDLRLGYASGFRAPALRELYYDFFDASHSIMGNPNLKAELSDSFTGSLFYSTNTASGLRMNSTLAGFYNVFTNRIDYGISATDASITTLINIGRYKTIGSTFEQKLIWKQLNVSVGFAYIGRYNSLNEHPTFAAELPEFVWSPEVNTNIAYGIPSIGADVSIFYKYNGARPVYQLSTSGGVSSAVLSRTDGFHLTDVMFTKKVFNTLHLNAGVRNLFDVTTVNNTAVSTGGAHSTGGGSVPLSYGRSYVFGLSFNWTKQ